MNTIKIVDGLIVEITKEHLKKAILDNFNEDEIFDLLLIGINKHKMLKSTIVERIWDDYQDDIIEFISKPIK